MPPGDEVRWWQDKLDAEFPRGLTASWEGKAPRDSPEGTYSVPRIEVTGMIGSDPLVYLPVPGWERTVAGPLSAYEVIQDKPFTLAKAKIGVGTMVLSGGVSDSLANQMRPFRDKWIALAKERGRSSFA